MAEFHPATPSDRDLAIADLVGALLALLPTHRNPDDLCWCSQARDIAGYGHEERCLKVRASLVAAGASPVGYGFPTARAALAEISPK